MNKNELIDILTRKLARYRRSDPAIAVYLDTHPLPERRIGDRRSQDSVSPRERRKGSTSKGSQEQIGLDTKKDQ